MINDYVKEIWDVTPVQEVGKGVFLKRDDLFRPFDDIPLNGGKVRQCMSLLIDNWGTIKEKCNSKVVTASNISSPQGIIVARCCREFGIESETFIGGSSQESAKKHILIQNIIRQGGKVNTECRIGYTQVVQNLINKKKESGEKFFDVGFGFNVLSQKESIVDSISNQVRNLPNDLDYLFVPCGSAITFSAILKGLVKYEIRPKRVVGIQIAGYDRTNTINSIVNNSIEYEFLKSKDYPYSKHLKLSFAGVRLDRVYESKAMDYIAKYLSDDIKGKRWCFWIVGDSSDVRDNIY